MLAQDLAGDLPVDISHEVIHKENKITIPEELISRVGLAAASKGDKSEPGLVIKFKQ